MWGEETDSHFFLLSQEVTGTPQVSTLGVQPAETWWSNQGILQSPGTWWSNQGSCVSRCWGLGLCGSPPSAWVRLSVPRGPISVVYLQFTCVCLDPSEIPNIELRVLPWLTCSPFSSVHLVVIWGQVTLIELLLRVLLSESLMVSC